MWFCPSKGVIDLNKYIDLMTQCIYSLFTSILFTINMLLFHIDVLGEIIFKH